MTDDALFSAAAANDASALDALCRKHEPLVRALVSRAFPFARAEREDLLQVGRIGLLRAIRAFDATRGFCFSTYAVPVILGELHAYYRSGGALKVGRGIRQNATRFKRAQEVLGEEATVAECAAYAGITEEEAALSLSATVPLVSMDDLATTPPATEDAEFGALLDRLSLLQCMSELSRKDRALIDLRFFRGLSQEKCARVLGMTQVQVSRAQKRILSSLRQKIAS